MDKGVVGYGLVKDDFTIEEHDLASFVYMNDAVNYIEMRVGGEISNQKIYYVDVRDEGKDTLRYLYDPAEGKLLSPEDLQMKRWDISVSGYQVTATQEFDEDGEYDFTTENKTCFSYDAAERIKQRYIEYGYTDINIDDTEISIKDFWCSEKFIKGDTPHQERTNTEEALATYKAYQRSGATIYEKIGMALEKIDTQDMIQYFKDKIPGGEHLLRDYIENQIVANEINKERSRNEIGRGER